MVEVSLTVGKLDTSLALLLTEDHHLIEFPTLLLPNDVQAGSIVKITCGRALDEEKHDHKALLRLQDEVLKTFGEKQPSTPVLGVRNVTQTSVVLEWNPIDVATADIISLVLYKNGAKFGAIPTPLKRTATKLSGLSIDTAYTFHLKLSTSSGTYESEQITVKTHKMTDLTGITICVGQLSDGVTREQLEKTAEKIGAKPLQDQVKLDTTHFICTEAEGAQFKRAQDLNIPVVRPEWLYACETERRLVGVRAYYLNADPKLRPPAPRSRATSAATDTSSIKQSTRNNSIPDVQVTEASPIPNRSSSPRGSSDHGSPEASSTRVEDEEPEETGNQGNSKVSIKVDSPEDSSEKVDGGKEQEESMSGTHGEKEQEEKAKEEKIQHEKKAEDENIKDEIARERNHEENTPKEDTKHGKNASDEPEQAEQSPEQPAKSVESNPNSPVYSNDATSDKNEKNLTGSETAVDEKSSSSSNLNKGQSSDTPLSKSQKKKMKKKAKSTAANTMNDSTNKNNDGDMDEVDL